MVSLDLSALVDSLSAGNIGRVEAEAASREEGGLSLVGVFPFDLIDSVVAISLECLA